MKIEKGDTVIIECQNRVVRATVDTAVNWAMPDEPEDWYIEFHSPDIGGCGYWKQGVDGGSVKRE